MPIMPILMPDHPGITQDGSGRTPNILEILAKPTQGLYAITGPVDENLIFWLILMKACKTPHGLDKVLDILKALVTQTADVLGDVARAGAANEVQAWSAGRLISLWMERQGQITQSQATDYIKGLNLLVGIGTIEGLLQTIVGTAHDFPSTLNLGAKVTGAGEVAKTVAPLLAGAL